MWRGHYGDLIHDLAQADHDHIQEREIFYHPEEKCHTVSCKFDVIHIRK